MSDSKKPFVPAKRNRADVDRDIRQFSREVQTRREIEARKHTGPKPIRDEEEEIEKKHRIKPKDLPLDGEY
jgi:hypothetical protein